MGNIASFLYFKSKKRDISSVIYMLITANDIVVSITVLPVGISYLSRGRPGMIFGDKYGCEVWQYVWNTAISLSVFLVLCLCTTRTISLLKPFQRQEIRYLVLALVTYLVINVAITAILNSFDGVKIMFGSARFRCETYFKVEYVNQKAEYKAIFIAYSTFYIAPAIVVTISCVLSAMALRKSGSNEQRELQKSRNRATVTILLFALQYVVCNLPLVIDYVVFTVGVITGNWHILSEFYKFDEQLHVQNAITTLLPAANSAANPILYIWRMPALREYIKSGIRRMYGLQRKYRTSPTLDILQQAESRPCGRVIENINTVPQLCLETSRTKESEI